MSTDVEAAERHRADERDADADTVDAAPADDIPADDTADPAVARFRLIAGIVVGATSLYLAWLVRDGRLGIGYQGDEGLRVFDADQDI